MHKDSCWEWIEASLLRHAKAHDNESKYPLFQYFIGHLTFFHKGDDEFNEKAKKIYRDWRFDDGIKKMVDRVKAI
jgi:hypothetical protein